MIDDRWWAGAPVAAAGAAPPGTDLGVVLSALADSLNALIPGLAVLAQSDLRHYVGTASSWDTRSVAAQPNLGVLVSGANPLRVGLAVQLPAGLAAWIGPNNQVSSGAAGITPGYSIPIGGGWLFGPENTLDVYLIHANAAAQDIRILELFTRGT